MSEPALQESAHTIGFARASRDRDGLVALHQESLPDSLLSCLGRAALERYYDFVIDSKEEAVFVCRAEERVIGGCVLTYQSQSLLSRFVQKAPLRFALELAQGVRKNRALARRLWLRLQERNPSGPDLPEVVQIFTAASQRGRGIGRDLLSFAEKTLADRAIGEYCIHTLRDDNEAGRRFYRRHGFQEVSEGRSFGDFYVLMTKGSF